MKGRVERVSDYGGSQGNRDFDRSRLLRRIAKCARKLQVKEGEDLGRGEECAKRRSGLESIRRGARQAEGAVKSGPSQRGRGELAYSDFVTGLVE